MGNDNQRAAAAITKADFDPEKFAGVWYLISYVENPDNKSECTSVKYRFTNTTGTDINGADTKQIKAEKYCMVNNIVKTVGFILTTPNPQDPGKMRLRTNKSNSYESYYIYWADDAYRTAIVGNGRDRINILYREPKMTYCDYLLPFKMLEQHGFDPKKLSINVSKLYSCDEKPMVAK